MISGETVHVSGVRIFYREAGVDCATAKSPALLIHGLGAHGSTWNRVVPAWARVRHLIIPDLPGHGRSGTGGRASYRVFYYARIMIGLLDALGVEKAALVGHSLGGAVAIAMSLSHPERVERLALIDAAGLDPIGIPWRTRWAFVPSAIATWFGVSPSERQIARFLAKAKMTTFADGEKVAADFATPAPDRKAAIRTAVRLVTDSRRLYQSLPEVNLPTLSVFGSDDTLFSAPVARTATHLLPRGQFVELAGVGHSPMLDAPDVLSEAIVPFLNESATVKTRERSPKIEPGQMREPKDTARPVRLRRAPGSFHRARSSGDGSGHSSPMVYAQPGARARQRPLGRRLKRHVAFPAP